MAKTLKDLALALINATLILVALCLFLGWKLATTAQSLMSDFSQKVQIVAPLREEVQGVRSELAALRTELATIQVNGALADTATAQRVSQTLDRLSQIEDTLQAAQSRIVAVAETPDAFISTSIEKTADTVADRIITIKGCSVEG
ncbi:hypothetical protein [Ruegeria faecimaris]|uniref:hypothetical protein n=1 Tax=Ruegeria faecimaris TaxID=686389 RepID=UPI0024937884|nr:hypothetical protein [Ruegeria faecimaris]